MLRIDRKQQTFALLDTPTLAEVAISERYDLREFICNSPQAFFQELGVDLFLICTTSVACTNLRKEVG